MRKQGEPIRRRTSRGEGDLEREEPISSRTETLKRSITDDGDSIRRRASDERDEQSSGVLALALSTRAVMSTV